MASGRVQFLTCSNCGITVRDLGTLNPSCYKCHSPLQANNRKARTGSGRSGELGWSSRTSSSGEQQEEEEELLADGRTSDVESRNGGLGWKSRSSREQTELHADGRTSDAESRNGGLGWKSRSSREQTELHADGRTAVGGVGDKDASNLLQFESSVNRIAARVDGSLNLAASDTETSRTRHGPRQSLFSSSASVVSSEDTFDGDDDTSSWNGDYPGSPHSAAYEPSVSSEEGYLSRVGGVSRRTRKPRGLARASNPVGESSFGSMDAAAASGDVPQGRFFPPRPRGDRFLSDTSGSLGGSSGNRSQVLEASSSSGSRELSGYNWEADPLAQASSSSGELGRASGFRHSQYNGGGNLRPPVASRHLNPEASGRNSLDGLREVNPYGLSPSSRPPQVSPTGTRIPPSPSHYQPSPQASRSIHCCAHCRSEACRAFEQFGVDLCCANGDCSTCSHTCCQPLSVSASSGQQCHGRPNPFIPKPSNAQEHDGGQALKAKEKKKRYSRPVFGGAGFIVCYECDELLQMPEDFHFSKTRRNKLRCGECDKVIVYCIIDKTRIVPYKDAVNQKIMGSCGRGRVDGGGGGHRPSKSHGAADASSKDATNHSRSDQLSYNDNYSGAYSDGAGSTEGTSCTRHRRDWRDG